MSAVVLSLETEQEMNRDFDRLWEPPCPIHIRDEIRRMIHNGTREMQAISRDREDFDLDHWDPNLQTTMTSDQRHERAVRLIMMSREIEEKRRVA